MRFVSAILLGLLAAGCAAPSQKPMTVSARQTSSEAQKQRETYTEAYVADLRRVRKVHWELATKAVALCPRKAAALGAEILTKPKGELGLAMEKLYGVGDEPTVLFVLEGGPAESAGLKPRDRVVSIDGISAGEAKAIADRLRTVRDGAMVSLPVVARRGSATLVLAVTPVQACDYPVALDDQQAVNAHTDGERILIARGMVSFARTDEELALVIAHEMAHNTMHHIYAKWRNATGGIVADIALKFLARGLYQGSMLTQAASHAYSPEFEAEADYVSLYMLASTGYAIDDAPKFWRRMAAANPASIADSHTSSHPSTAYRIVALEEAVMEIQAKRQAGVALLPQKKDGKDGSGWKVPSHESRKGEANCFLEPDGRCSR